MNCQGIKQGSLIFSCRGISLIYIFLLYRQCIFRCLKTMIPNKYVQKLIAKNMPDMIQRGMRVRIISESHLILEDLDEWLWTDTHRLCTLSRYRLIFDVYSTNCNSRVSMGLVVSIRVLENSILWTILNYFTIFFLCMILVVWLMAIPSAWISRIFQLIIL